MGKKLYGKHLGAVGKIGVKFPLYVLALGMDYYKLYFSRYIFTTFHVEVNGKVITV